VLLSDVAVFHELWTTARHAVPLLQVSTNAWQTTDSMPYY
jgi:hypothetical protein